MTLRSYRFWLMVVLFTAVAFRFSHLATVPPGLTHDEADHGLSAWGILQGIHPIYFTIGYGREPLYDYATAGLMLVLGRTFLAERLTAVFFSLLLIASMAHWTRTAFNRRTALFTAAGLAVGFWAVMTSRQALRSITLPALFTLAVAVWWQAVNTVDRGQWIVDSGQRKRQRLALGAGVLLGLTFYTYIPARVLWLVLPLTVAYMLWQDRATGWRMARLTAVTLFTMALVAAPLLIHLATHPAAETRIGQLSRPLQEALAGDPTLLAHNVVASLQLFTFRGDTAVRYNIPGQPWLPPALGLLFYLGLALTLHRLFVPSSSLLTKRRFVAHSSLLTLAWLTLGLLPSLITGPELSSTQAIGLQPVLYLFPALALDWLLTVLSSFFTTHYSLLTTHFPFALFLLTALATRRDYFQHWANDPQVRVQYESSMSAAMAYLNDQPLSETAVSTITPGPFHTAALAQMTLREERPIRWFNASGSLLLPASPTSTLILPGFTPIPTALAAYGPTAVATEIPLPLTDLDRPLLAYPLNRADLLQQWANLTQPVAPVVFGDAVRLMGYDLQTPQVAPGGELRLITWWHVLTPQPDLTLFIHVQGAGGVPIAQTDRLDAPSYSWRSGDDFVQLHLIAIPTDAANGRYPLAVGWYTPDHRLPILATGADILPLTEITIQP